MVKERLSLETLVWLEANEQCTVTKTIIYLKFKLVKYDSPATVPSVSMDLPYNHKEIILIMSQSGTVFTY